MTDLTPVQIDVTAHEVAVKVKGLPHLLLRRSGIQCIQSWKMTIGSAEPYFMIEITMRAGKVITCEYDDRTLWEDILKKLGAARLFDNRLGEVA